MEEEIVAELKSISKEICLPSIEGEMQRIYEELQIWTAVAVRRKMHADWKAGIESIAATTKFSMKLLGFTSASHSINTNSVDDGEDQTYNPKRLKHYHIKGQKLLDEILEKLNGGERSHSCTRY